MRPGQQKIMKQLQKNKNPNNEGKFLYRKSLKENSEGLN